MQEKHVCATCVQCVRNVCATCARCVCICMRAVCATCVRHMCDVCAWVWIYVCDVYDVMYVSMCAMYVCDVCATCVRRVCDVSATHPVVLPVQEIVLQVDEGLLRCVFVEVEILLKPRARFHAHVAGDGLLLRLDRFLVVMQRNIQRLPLLLLLRGLIGLRILYEILVCNE